MFVILFLSLFSFSQDIKVAIVDSGIEKSHSFFKGKKINDFDMLDYNSSIDETGHGTHVSGIYFKYSEAREIYVLKNMAKYNEKIEIKNKNFVLDKEGKTINEVDMSFYKIIQFAIEKNIKILNISETTNFYSQKLESAFKLAEENGILIIASAGNERQDLSFFDKYEKLFYENKYPCSFRFKNIICVGSIDEEKNIYSNYSKKYVDVFALGENVTSSSINDLYKNMSGSSMAAPKITALAFKIWNENKNLNFLDVKNKLFKSLPFSKKIKKFSSTGKYYIK